MSNVLVISTSLRAKSNSDILTEQLIAGAKDAGHEVEHISKGKECGHAGICHADLLLRDERTDEDAS